MVRILNKIINMWRKGYYYSHKKLETKAFPTVNNIEPTNACAMRCIMCPRKYMKRKIGFMNLTLFEKIIKQLKRNSYIDLHHFGDPLLHQRIGEMIKICKRQGIETSFSTNPTMLTEDNIKQILDSELDNLHLSLDGAIKRTYEKIRGGVADYETAIKNINNFLKEKSMRKCDKPFVNISIIRMKETKTEIKKFKKQWENKPGIDKISVKEFITWDGSMDDITSLADEFSHKYKRKNYYPCIWPWAKLTVLWDGRVVPCCFDYDGKVILGDLTKQSLKDIWESDIIKKFRKQQLEGSFPKRHLCKKCKEREGFPPSKIFPFNIILRKRFKFLKYFRFN